MSAVSSSSVLWLAIGLAAQAPRDAKALAEALASPEAEVVAWAAHHARALGDNSLVAPLQRALATWRLRMTWDGGLATVHVLDALVALRARVPAADLLPLLDDRRWAIPTASFLLLAHHPRQNEAELLALFRDGPRADGKADEQLVLRTRAIGNLLASQQTPGFARLVWERMPLELVVEIGERRKERGRREGRPMLHRESLPARFPPRPIHWLLDTKDPVGAFLENEPLPRDRNLLAGGPQPVFTGRSEHLPIARAPLAQRLDGIAWLHELAQPAIPQPPEVVHVLGDDEEGYLAAVDAARTKLRTYMETLRRELVARKALTADEAKALPTTVAVTVDDQRTDKSKPLPAIPEQER